jgi:hypothetical protein
MNHPLGIRVAMFYQQVHKITRPATDDKDSGLLVLRNILEIISLIELVIGAISPFDVFGGFPKGVERLDLRR